MVWGNKLFRDFYSLLL